CEPRPACMPGEARERIAKLALPSPQVESRCLLRQARRDLATGSRATVDEEAEDQRAPCLEHGGRVAGFEPELDRPVEILLPPARSGRKPKAAPLTEGSRHVLPEGMCKLVGLVRCPTRSLRVVVDISRRLGLQEAQPKLQPRVGPRNGC